LLIGYPFSPLVAAARALRRQDVPYIVDISDPWALTRQGPRARTLRERRSAVLEHRLWNGATAGIVTTTGQSRDLLDVVPALDVLVRPNGYTHVEPRPGSFPRQADNDLRIGHFGNLYAPRLDVEGFFRRLAESRRWQRVIIYQYGRDHDGELGRLSQVVTIERREPVPWADVVRLAAAELDVALVIGNKDARQLPSKAIDYLTLPVPRLALTGGRTRDALAEYVESKPGWLLASVDDPNPAPLIWEHVRRNWNERELAPPADESWAHVADELASFVLRQVERGSKPMP
jgi:hypothetical protein